MKKNTLILITSFCFTVAFGQNWTGAVNSDWNNSSNWSTTPSNGDNIVIDPANYTGAMAQPVIAINSNFTPAEMLVQNGAQLTISATLNTTDRVEVIGIGTTVTINNSGAFSLIGAGNNARLIFVDDAHLEMNGGVLSSGQRLLFELGATGTIHDGTVTVGETIALVDGSAIGSSKLVQNGGTITTNAEFGFENEAGAYYPTFEQNGGTLHVNGSLLWLGAAPGAGKGYFRSNGGFVFVTGTIGNEPTSTMGMHLEVNGSSTVFENSGPGVTVLEGDSLVLADSATWRDVNAPIWMNNGVVYGSDNTLFQSANTTFNGFNTGIGIALYQLGNLTVPTGKTFNHVYPFILRISGNMNILGSFNNNSNQLIWNGTKNQSIDHAANNLTFYALQVENKANGPIDGGYGISLNTTINIINMLDLTDGIIVSAPGKLVKLADDIYALTGHTDSTFIDGYVEKTGNDAFTFPVGMAPDRHRPLTITPPDSVSTQIKVGYINAPYSNLTPVEAPMQSVSALEYWDFTNSNPNDLLGVTVGWDDASQSGLTDCADISLTVWNGIKWAFAPSGTSGLCNGTNEGSLFSYGNLPANGPITIGFTNNVTQQSVTLCPGGTFNVGSSTYDQSGTYVNVLQDINGDDSTVVTVVTVLPHLVDSVSNNITFLIANVNSLATQFQWIDCLNGFSPILGEVTTTFTPAQNGSYAIIASHNGCYDTSECIIIDQLGLSEWNKPRLEIYPNPVSNGEKLMISSNASEFIIQSLDGKMIRPKSVTLFEETCEIELPVLSTGIYLISETGVSEPHTGRFSVH